MDTELSKQERITILYFLKKNLRLPTSTSGEEVLELKQ